MHLLTQSPLLKALGWALFDSLWQMALLWLLYSLLITVFSRIAAGIRHGLALLLVSLGACWSVATFFVAWCGPVNDHGMTNSWLNFLPAIQQGRFGQVSRLLTDEILADGSSLYLLISGGLLIRYLYHYRQARQLTRQGLSKLPSAFRVFVAATSRQMGIRSAVSVWLSSRIDVPLTLGHLKPVILLPLAMINHLTPMQVEAILVHELAHIRRNDYLLHLLAAALEGLFFFNPFTRLLIGQIKKERENCCDDLVLQFRYDPHSYVSALLSLATRGQKIRPAIAATGDGQRLLLQRAKRILQQKKSRDWPGVRPLLLLLFILFITLITTYGPIHQGTQGAARRALPVVITPGAHPARAHFQMGVSTPTARFETSVVITPAHLGTPGTSPVQPASLPHPAAAVISMTTTRPRRQEASAVAMVIDADGSQPGVDGSQPRPDDSQPGADDNQPGIDDVAMINTADVELATPSAEVSLDMPSAETAPREYSIRRLQPTSKAGRMIKIHATPYVPSSSFAYQFTAGDSTHTAEQLSYLQQSTRNEILIAMNNLHRQFEVQMITLAKQEIKAAESVKLRLQLRSQELKLQQSYLKKLAEWEKKLENPGHVRMIVYI